jgi:hypothetical protein
MRFATGPGRKAGSIVAFAAKGPKKFIRPPHQHRNRKLQADEDPPSELRAQLL